MKKYLPALLAIIPAIFLYRMIFLGEIVTTNDELERHPINQWRDSYLAENEDMPQWYPNLFSGMPSYGGYIHMTGDPTKYLRNTLLFNPGIKVWFFLSLTGFGMFILLQFIGVSRMASILGGLMTGLTPYSFGLVNAGHLNKIFAMAYIPWVFVSVLYLMKRPSIKSILLFALAAAIQLWANHPQIVYYTWMVIGFYWVWVTGASLKEKSFSIKTSSLQLGGIIGSLIIALLMVSDPYLEVYNFQKHSNRGAKSVMDQTGETASGTGWNYATQWSFHPKETISFLFPYHYGLQNSQDPKKGAYWGFMRFTQSTHYLGLVAIIFAIFGALLRKPDKLEWFFWITTILVLITGFGSFFPILYKPFFDYFPFFSKFRIPSMIYVLLAVTLPILAAKGFDTFQKNIEEKETFKKAAYVAGGIGVLSILFLLFGESLFYFSNASDTRYNPSVISKLRSFRVDLFQKGLLLGMFVSLGSLGLIWGAIQKKLSKEIFGYLILGLVVLDLWIVNAEFINVKPAKNMDLMFQANSMVTYLNNDQDYFRVYPADELNSNKYSYWNVESIGGYRPIKLRNYQDLMDAKGFSRPHILNMLNVKYVLTRKKINNPNFVPISDFPGVYKNKNALPKAWIVGDVKSVATQKESLMETLLNRFDPSQSAIVVNYEGDPMPENASGGVTIKTRKENRIELECSSETGGLLVLSEIYYKPGWRAFVDGTETKIYQTNHVLRSINVPSGNSKVIFEYDDKNWKNTRRLSRVSFLIVLLGIGFLFWKEQSD